MNPVYVLDACALIAFLRNEAGADIVSGFLYAAHAHKADVYMNAINLLEVYYDIYRTTSKAKADEELRMIKKLPISIQSEITEDVFNEAGRLKASYRISLADSIALAQASSVNGKLLTADHHEFDILQDKVKIDFVWIR